MADVDAEYRRRGRGFHDLPWNFWKILLPRGVLLLLRSEPLHQVLEQQYRAEEQDIN